MTVSDLIQKLKNLNPDFVIKLAYTGIGDIECEIKGISISVDEDIVYIVRGEATRELPDGKTVFNNCY